MPAAASKALVGVRFVVVPCALGGAGATVGAFFFFLAGGIVAAVAPSLGGGCHLGHAPHLMFGIMTN